MLTIASAIVLGQLTSPKWLWLQPFTKIVFTAHYVQIICILSIEVFQRLQGPFWQALSREQNHIKTHPKEAQYPLSPLKGPRLILCLFNSAKHYKQRVYVFLHEISKLVDLSSRSDM